MIRTLRAQLSRPSKSVTKNFNPLTINNGVIFMNKHYSKHQSGLATLTVAVVILITVTLMVIFATKVGVFDQRMSANEIRYKEAFAQAEAGLDFATQKFNSQFRLHPEPLYDKCDPTTNQPDHPPQNDSVSCLDGIVRLALTNEDGDTYNAASTNPVPEWTSAVGSSSTAGGFQVSISGSGSNFGAVPIYQFVATGRSADGSGSATVIRQITMAHVLGGGKAPEVPVVVSGAVGTGGNFNIVGNPNAGGPGVPVSVWSNDTISVSSSSATCHQQFYTGGQCSNPSGNAENISRGTNPAENLTAPSATMPDLLPNDPNFPDDLFNFVFGMDRDNWALKKSEAASFGQVVNSCTPLNTAGTSAGSKYPLWWITGDCDITANKVIGSSTRPVILVIDDKQLKMNGGSKVYGVVYLFDNPSSNATPPTAQLTGGPEVYGSFISDAGGNAMNGNYSVVYTPAVQDSLNGKTGSGVSFRMTYVPGSWRDF